MKTYKKILSLVLTFAMIMSLCIVYSPSKTQAGVKIIVGKKLDINYGAKDVILVKGKAKAKSTSKKVAKITKVKKSGKNTKITVKGAKVGKAKIKIKVGGKTKKASVIVRPKSPKSLKVKSGSNYATLSWSKSKGASGYYVYRSENKSSGFKKIATSKKNKYVDKGLALGKYYYYKVIAFGSKKVKSEKYTKVEFARTWKLVWQDEFSGTKLNSNYWTHEIGHGNNGWGNQEKQNYQPEYAVVNGGKLEIRPTFQYNRTKGKNVDNSYYSSRIITKGKKQFKYAKVEYRAKLPKGEGTWAAGWMLGTGSGGSWPKCGEIDVFETTFQAAKTIIPQSLHMAKFNGMATSSGNKHWDTTINNATSTFHTYAVEWFPTFLRFTIDGKETGIYDPSIYTLEGDGTNDVNIWPYNKPFYLILNCAIGGTLGVDKSYRPGNVSSINPTGWTFVKSETKDGDVIETYQDKLVFDYIRVYE